MVVIERHHNLVQMNLLYDAVQAMAPKVKCCKQDFSANDMFGGRNISNRHYWYLNKRCYMVLSLYFFTSVAGNQVGRNQNELLVTSCEPL